MSHNPMENIEATINSSDGRVSFAGDSINLSFGQPQQNESLTKAVIDDCTWIQLGNLCDIQINTNKGHFYSISIPFPKEGSNPGPNLKQMIIGFLRETMQLTLSILDTSIEGHSFGNPQFGNHSFCLQDDKGLPIISLPYALIQNIEKAAKKDTDINITCEYNPNCEGHQFSNMRLFIPKENTNNADEVVTQIQAHINQAAGTENFTGEIAEVRYQTPRGKYSMRFCESLLFLHGPNSDIRVPYNQISKIHVLNKIGAGDNDQSIVMTLSQSIRIGASSYHFLVINASTDDDVKLNPTALNDNKWTMRKAIVSLFQMAANKEIEPEAKSFKAANGDTCLECSYKSSTGPLYMTKDAFFFLHNPIQYISYENVDSISIERVTENISQTNKLFDISIRHHGKLETKFINISPFSELGSLYLFLKDRKLRISNGNKIKKFIENQRLGGEREVRAGKEEALSKIRMEMKELGHDSDDESEDDGDFDPDAKPSSDAQENEEEENNEAAQPSESGEEKEPEHEGDDDENANE